MHRILIPLMIFGVIFAPFVARASGPVPIPSTKESAINFNADQIDAHKERQAQLKENLGKIDGEIDGLRASMIKVARDVKNRERDMSAIESQVDALQTKRTALQKKLQRDHADIAGLASALLHIRDIPPEALLARPGAPIETAQAAMILRDVITPLQTHAKSVHDDLTELAVLETDLKTRQAALKTASEKILADQTKLADLIRRREQAYASLQSDLKQQETELNRLAENASDFHDFIAKLQQRNRDIDAQEQKRLAAANAQKTHKTFTLASLPPPALDTKALKTLGDIQMPMSGIVRVGFGAMDDIGSQSQGMKIEGRAGALVVAPMNGIVRYKGKFKNYGNMVIIEHGKNYHSLVAGLSKIDTVVGQSVEAGEPLGSLGTNRSAHPALYYELRQNGKPVNPARLFADIG